MPVAHAHSPVTFAGPMTGAVDVVVIGAGVIGISTAWYLAEQGVSVLVCDKGRVAGEQSSRNWGWIRQQGRDAAELPIVIESVNRWEHLAGLLDRDIGFTRRGVLYVAENESQMADFEHWLQIAEQHQLDTRLLTGTEVEGLVSGRPGQFVGGMFTASDARAEPFVAVPAIARALNYLEPTRAWVREQCAVRALDVEAGRVVGVVTELGRVAAQSVVCAGGAWSSVFLGNMGVDLPQLTVRATVARTQAAPLLFDGNASLGDVAIRRRHDGGYTVASSNTNEHYVGADSFRYATRFLPALRSARGYIGLRFDGGVLSRLMPPRLWGPDDVSPFEKARVLNPAPSDRAVRRMRAALTRRVPGLADVPFEEAWAGMIDVTPDVVPVMDAVPQTPGLFVATGFSGHGFGIGPGAGRVMADLVTGRPPGHDLSRFRYQRFFDGSRMEPGPGL